MNKFIIRPRASAGCNKCNRPSIAACSRCALLRYCGRECQRADWPRHRDECGINRCHMMMIDSIVRKIMGNILIMYAHYGGEIVVKIDENLDSIVARHLAFAYLSQRPYPAADDHPRQSIFIKIEIHGHPAYDLEIDNITPAEQEYIRKKYTRPEGDWPIMFEL